MSNRERAKRRKELARDEVQNNNQNAKQPLGVKWGKQILLTGLFATAIIFICFVGQDPPSLRTLGEVAPENVYADRDFKYLSEVRRAEAEEWIRSKHSREFSQNFSGEEAYSKALIRLQEGLLSIENLAVDAQEQASLSLINELDANFQLIISQDEFLAQEMAKFFFRKRLIFLNNAKVANTSPKRSGEVSIDRSKIYI